ncbi:uncharacterized protein [Haliotis asinina]|uniref:uncharacterized protein n=1 Tax=Haliotis asinina TaxID=109174 RepID=UPI0035321AD8
MAKMETATLLLLLYFCHSSYSQDPCRSSTLRHIERRDPETPVGQLPVDDSRIRPGWYSAPRNWELLSRDPGGDSRCGASVPLYRRKKINANESEICHRLPVNPCYMPYAIPTRMCGDTEVYYLSATTAGSGYCFFDNGPCGSSPCANGGTCRDLRGRGYTCICTPYFTGRNCTIEIDPCKNYTLLENIENRDPSTPENPEIVHDATLPRGWYGAPGKWELLSRDPGGFSRCGTRLPIYRRKKYMNESEMCLRGQTIICHHPFNISTKMCGNKEVYYLFTRFGGARFCFVNNGPCASSPCANGGTCSDSEELGYRCMCAPGFTGQDCTVCVQDILIMEDVSRSIGQNNFEKVRRFAESLLEPLTINPSAANVAYMVFSTNARVVFGFSEYSNSKPGVLAALKNQTYESGSTTDIVEAVNVAVNSVFTPSKGDRPDAINVVIMFTDGFDTESKMEVIDTSILQLHDKAEVFVVALSDAEASSTVNSLASDPANIFQIDAASSLQTRLETCLNSMEYKK